MIGLSEQLEGELDAAGFFHPPEKRPSMIRNLRVALSRARFTDQEARTFRGVITALAKGRRMGSSIVDEFERPAAQRMRELIRAGRYSARLLPLMAAVYPSNAELGDLLATANPTGDASYAAWCGRAASTFPIVRTPSSNA